MSYDLTLYLKTAPFLSPQVFSKALTAMGVSGELAPDFIMDGSLSPLCAKLSGMIPADERTYLAVVDYIVSVCDTPHVFALPAPSRGLFRKKQPSPTLTVPANHYQLTFSCGMDHLELPFALLLCKCIAGADGLLFDPQIGCLALGESDIDAMLQTALQSLQNTPVDRLLLHEFDEWI